MSSTQANPISRCKHLADYIVQRAECVNADQLRRDANVAADAHFFLTDVRRDTRSVRVETDLTFTVDFPATWYRLDEFEHPLRDACDQLVAKVVAGQLTGWSILELHSCVEAFPQFGIDTRHGEACIVVRFVVELDAVVSRPPPAVLPPAPAEYVAELHAELARNIAMSV